MQRVNILHFVFFAVLMMRFVTSCDSCGPGQTGLRRTGLPKKYSDNKPLRQKQFVPNTDENSQKASGPAEGKILRKTRRFKKHLVRVDSRNIIFRDEERTGADRYMTRRCKEKLETLAVMVRNEWPGVKLFVTEAFDENYAHTKQSLHYEGRAVDIKTDDRDRKKYGVLARLAVKAGFDWVFYGSKAYIHVSCKSDRQSFLLEERCFHAESSMVVRKRHNVTEAISMRYLKIGDQILATDSSGQPVFSEMIAWIDADLSQESLFLHVQTENRLNLTLTSSHLVHVMDSTGNIATQFASELSPGDSLLTLADTSETSIRRFIPHKIVAITEKVLVGSLAPLTRHGTIVVNRISASCYAAVPSTYWAHAAFAPLRWWTSIFGISESRRTPPPDDGVHPYAKVLMILYKFVLPSHFFVSSSLDL